MEKVKYYRPEIEEFHEGFICEIESSWGWQKGTFPTVLKSDTLSGALVQKVGFWESLPNLITSLRVKYLDREDIESLGWTDFQHSACDWYKWKNFVECPMNHYYHHALRLQHDYSKNGLTIKAYEFEHLMEQDKDPVNLYRGIVKNKSELVQIMKQLNIK